jgi:hypothetical protein
LRIEDGIQAMRSLLRRCWFDADKCAKGVDAPGVVFLLG